MEGNQQASPLVWGVVANVLSDRVLRTGAKVWLLRCNGDAERPIVRGISKSGKWIEKFTHYKRLGNYRAAWCPDHMRNHVAWLFDSKETADALAQALSARWAGVRLFNRDGSVLLRDGVSVRQAWERPSR